MPVVPLRLGVDPERDDFLLWLRWVAMESPPSPEEPPHQGLRVEFQLNRSSVVGPEIYPRRRIEPDGLWILAPRCNWRPLLACRPAPRFVDLQLIIHGSIANAPYVALYHLRDAQEPQGPQGWDPKALGTPLLQLQPSVPAGQWRVSGQSNLRAALDLVTPRGHLRVLRDP